MAEEHPLLSQILPGSSDWIIKLKVIEIGKVQKARRSDAEFMKVILMDREGKKIEATMFNDEVQTHGSLLSVGRYYNFSNGKIRFIDPAFRVVQNDYQLILNRDSKIEEVLSEETYEANIMYNFVALSDVGKFLYEGFEIDIIAVVLDVSPIRHVTRHIDNAKVPICDLLIVDQKLQPICLSVWNDLATNECKQIADLFPCMPVIIATHVKVQSFKGLSLSTRSLTSITINPDTDEAKDIQSWSIRNSGVIAELRLQKATNITSMQGSSLEIKVTPMKHIFDTKQNMKCSIQGIVTRISVQNQPWYVSCSACMKKTSQACGENFICEHCNKSATAEARCILRLQITDDTFSTWVTLFGPNAEKILACTADELRDGGSFQVLASSALNKKFTFHVTSSDETYQNRRGKKLNVIGIDEVCPPSQTDEKEDHGHSKRLKIALADEKGEMQQSKGLKINSV